jgi:alkaline phosphatase D
VVAAEVCGTSLASQGWPQAQYDAYLADNPHLLFGRSDRRGYCLFTIAGDCRVDVRAVGTVKQKQTGIETLASFVIEDGVRGIHKA